MEEKIALYQTGTESKTIFDRALNYLKSKYFLRYNTISLEFEIRISTVENWTNLNLNSLYIELIQAGIDIPINKLEILVRSHLIDQYDPISEYFESLDVWDGEIILRNFAPM